MAGHQYPPTGGWGAPGGYNGYGPPAYPPQPYAAPPYGHTYGVPPYGAPAYPQPQGADYYGNSQAQYDAQQYNWWYSQQALQAQQAQQPAGPAPPPDPPGTSDQAAPPPPPPLPQDAQPPLPPDESGAPPPPPPAPPPLPATSAPQPASSHDPYAAWGTQAYAGYGAPPVLQMHMHPAAPAAPAAPGPAAPPPFHGASPAVVPGPQPPPGPPPASAASPALPPPPTYGAGYAGSNHGGSDTWTAQPASAAAAAAVAPAFTSGSNTTPLGSHGGNGAPVRTSPAYLSVPSVSALRYASKTKAHIAASKDGGAAPRTEPPANMAAELQAAVASAMEAATAAKRGKDLSTGLGPERGATAVQSTPGPASQPRAPTAAPAAPRPQRILPPPPAQQGVPPSVGAYVKRVLEAYQADEEVKAMKKVLADIIRAAHGNGTLWSIDWDTKPAPRLPGRDGHAANAAAARPAPGAGSGRLGGALAEHDDEGARAGPGRGAGAWKRGGKAGRAAAAAAERLKKRGQAQARGGPWGSDSESGGSDAARMTQAERAKRARRAGRFAESSGAAAAVNERINAKKPKARPASGWGAAEPAVSGRGAYAGGDGARYAGLSDRFAYMDFRRQRVEEAAAEEGDAIDFDAFVVKGTCSNLEKSYFRLTSAPSAVEVRPEPVLAAALARLVAMIREQQRGYLYYNDQFKAMRQDLVVQHVHNELTVQVYEAHARAALEYGDHSEYNQCQAQLNLLYAEGVPGNAAEFAAYRLLYQSVHARHGEGRKVNGTMLAALEGRVGQVADSPEVQHALKVRAALAGPSYKRFFQLYASAPPPGLSRALMDIAAARVRWSGLNTLVRALKPSPLPLPMLARVLGFDSVPAPPAADAPVLPGCSAVQYNGDSGGSADAQEALSLCFDWLAAHGASFSNPHDPLAERVVDTKASAAPGVLSVPVDTRKVAHGDANLDINDFLSKVVV